jgi:hypothetical protein
MGKAAVAPVLSCPVHCGVPRIHGELLKLGIDIGQTSVARYMARRRGPPSQGWKTFLRNHADGIAAMDLFVVPTVSFRLLYGLLIMGHGRRQILWLGVMDRQPAHGSLWLGANPSPSDPRSGCLLWPDICPTRSFARDSRSPNLSTLALSKWLCGAPDRLDPPRMPAPRAYRRPTRAWGTVPSIRADLICDSDRMEFSERTGP